MNNMNVRPTNQMPLLPQTDEMEEKKEKSMHFPNTKDISSTSSNETNSKSDAEHLTQHRHLASIVKGVHKHLRRKFRENNENAASVWEQHKENQDMLQEYAKAMRSLAENHWSVYPETRIQWCMKVIVDFYHHNQLAVALEKDAKRKYYEEKRRQNEIKKQNNNSCMESCKELTGVTHEHDVNMHPPPNFRSDVHVPIEGKISLLDVGSCYNPFQAYDELEAVGIDLCPAAPSVLQCDFLNVTVQSPTSSMHQDDTSNPPASSNHQEDSSNPPASSIYLNDPSNPSASSIHLQDFSIPPASSIQQENTSYPPSPSSHHQIHHHHYNHSPHSRSGVSSLATLISPIKELPGGAFHVVVFSLLLEYLPSPSQRLLCCIKAHDLLANHGLLLIITPDSHSQHRNAPMMKSWKQAIETLGFRRWKYEKKEHVHCMAFRKVSDEHCSMSKDTTEKKDHEELAKLLYIPQDLNDACYQVEDCYFGEDSNVQSHPCQVDQRVSGEERSDEADDNERICSFVDVISELPIGCASDDDAVDEDVG